MAGAHSTGPIQGTRQAGNSVIHSIPVSFADPTGVAKRLITIAGTVQEPVGFRIYGAVVMTIFDAATTTATVQAGIVGGTYLDMLPAASVKVTAGTNLTLSATNPVKVVTADTPIFAIPTYTGTAPASGLITLMFEVWPINVTEPTNQGG